MRGQHGAQGEVGADIRVEHEEGLRTPRQDLVPEVVETTPSAQGGKLLQVPVPPGDPRTSSVSLEETDWVPLGFRRLPVLRSTGVWGGRLLPLGKAGRS